MKTVRKPRRSKAKMGPRFSTLGFYVEGRSFGKGTAALEFACSFAARLVQEYGRPVSVDAAIFAGYGKPAFMYFPEDSCEAEFRMARRDQHGYVLVCS